MSPATGTRMLLLAVVLAGLVAGCANPWVEDSAKLENQDSDLAVRVKAALIAEPGLAGAAIDVEIEAGQAVLSGFVETEEQSRVAARIAREEQGISAVLNKLAVK